MANNKNKFNDKLNYKYFCINSIWIIFYIYFRCLTLSLALCIHFYSTYYNYQYYALDNFIYFPTVIIKMYNKDEQIMFEKTVTM